MCGYILFLFYVFDGVNLWCYIYLDFNIVYKNNIKFFVDFLCGVFFLGCVERR